MGWDEDRRRARERLSELEQLAGSAVRDGVTPDARLGAFAAAASATALLLFADALHEAMGRLEQDILPELGRIFGAGEGGQPGS